MDKPIPSLAIRGTHTNVQLGFELRDAALEVLEQRRKVWVADVRRYALYYIRQHGAVTVDNLREAFPLPEGVDARVFGAVLMGKVFKKIGNTKTTRPTSHARPIGIFGAAS